MHSLSTVVSNCYKRKYVFLTLGLVITGGTTACVSPFFGYRRKASDSCTSETSEKLGKLVENKCRLLVGKNKRYLESLKVLVTIILQKMGKRGAAKLLAMLAVAVCRTMLSNRLAEVQGFLFRATFLKHATLFYRLMSENILLCFILSAMHSTLIFLRESSSLYFRSILTDVIHLYYFEDIAYYKISHVNSKISSPEQRIASDVPKFCSELSDLVLDDLIASCDIMLYTWRLYTYSSPRYLLFILAYVMGAGNVIRRFSPAFGKLLSKEQQLESEYRRLHSRIRVHVESIAFYGGEQREKYHILQKFRALTRHLKASLYAQWWFNIIQDFLVKYLGATFAVVLIIEPFFTGHTGLDTSYQGNASMLSNMRYHTSVIISLFQSLGMITMTSKRLNRLSGYADRINELMLALKDIRDCSSSNSSRSHFSDADYIEFDSVKIVTPTGHLLVEDLSLRVKPGSNLLITGPNGSGKSSIFRVLGGLWPMVHGHIAKPGTGTLSSKDIFYVPQRPYAVVGTLCDQLIYPSTIGDEIDLLSHSMMLELLRQVDLEHIMDRYPPDKIVNWGEELSLGEQQRLGMARLFFHKPKFAILDECTSAVTTEMEKHFYSKVRAMGTSCITISHRPALIAFHDIILSLNGEGGWDVNYKRMDSPFSIDSMRKGIIDYDSVRQNDALVVKYAFSMGEKASYSKLSKQSYTSDIIAASSNKDTDDFVPMFMQLDIPSRALPSRIIALSRILVPTIFDKQASQLLVVASLVLLRTLISDRIASLNGSTVKYVLAQDKSSFIRLIGVSVLQSVASSVIAPSLRQVTALLALGWRIKLTQHLLKYYFKNNAFYKVFKTSSRNIDADQRITQDLNKLTSDLSGLVTSMVKPSIDILWFSWRMMLLTGQQGIVILYAYMFVGLGFLRAITPDFGTSASTEQQLEGTFRYMHERLRTHAESIAFFGGGLREKIMIEFRFRDLFNHSTSLQKKKWFYGILDDFVTKQLPHNVTWFLSMLFAMEHGDHQATISSQGELAHTLRFLASVVTQSFLAFGDILELQKKLLELSGSINRVFELEEFLCTVQSDNVPSAKNNNDVGDKFSFEDVDIVTPTQKLLARRLTCTITPGTSLLITGPNGSGKTSIFRVLKGLWPVASGKLSKPSGTSVEVHQSCCGTFFVPQGTYTTIGPLRNQIIYPLSCDEAEIHAQKLHVANNMSNGVKSSLDLCLKMIMESVKLNYLLEREGGLDANMNWEDVLSLGEQQRLGMARLFFHRPMFGILDECTNATSVDVEEQLYALAKDMGITVITSSQRPALMPFHSMELRLIDGDGNWEIREIHEI